MLMRWGSAIVVSSFVLAAALMASAAGGFAGNRVNGASAAPNLCVPPGIHFGGARYNRELLVWSFVRVKRRIGDAQDVSGGCVDAVICVIGQPCSPPPAPPRSAPAPIRVHLIAGISPRVALSEGGSSRRILIAVDRCTTAVTERALLRCLRRVRA
jgi:hypothetical protein